jgi:UDP-glucose:(heptosyl)LPS alpha-1,3-glucosyltransferase
MNIALLTQSCDNETGIGRIVLSLAKEFVSRGHDVDLVAQVFDNTPAGTRTHRIPSAFRLNSVNRLFLRYASGHVVRSLHCDIVNSFAVGRGASVITAQSCHRAGVVIRNEQRNGRIWRRNLGFFDHVALADERFLFCSSHTQRIIAVSALVRNQIVSYYGVEPERIAVIPNGVDVHRFTQLQRTVEGEAIRRTLGVGAGECLLLFVGNEFDRKGLQYIIESIAALRRSDLRLLVVGADDRRPYRELARRLHVEDKILFAGKVNGPEEYFFAADIFVLPTLYEPFGLVILEAMAAGVPVITAKDAGAVEGLRHGVHGLYLDDPRSVDELSQTIQQLTDDEELRRQMSSVNLAAVRNYSWERIAEKTLDVYRQIV